MTATEPNRQERKTTETAAGKLGTFAGVFTPSVLTILGIILFLRLGYVVGNAGLGRALLIIGLANAISILTSQSLAAIATNLRVKGGGDYYLISRTLGYQFGGAIGMVLYLAQSVSVAFYCIGFAEALTAITQLPPFFTSQVVALLAAAALFGLAWLGADWATRFQYVIMLLLAAALFSFFWGGLHLFDANHLAQNWSPPEKAPPFWVVFGIFFPAVTGFTQGVSMSGDLKDPGKSLPTGTFMAVGVSIVVYFAMAVVFAGTLPNQVMMTDFQAIKRVARYDMLIDAGVIAATLSSAMASFLGGPRILQSLAADRIFPFVNAFAKGAGAGNNPRRAVLLTAGIAAATIALGQLNLVARVVSMFFLISYGLLNYATYYEAQTASPSFRPRFRWFNKHLSLLGFLICLGTILALDVQNGLIAVAILIAIHQYLKRSGAPARWADSSRAHAFQVARKQIHAIAQSSEHHRNWRPHILAFTNREERRVQLLTFAWWVEGHSGLVTAVRIIEGNQPRKRQLHRKATEELAQDIRKNQLDALPLVVRGENVATTLPVLLQSYGVGPLRANTVLLNWMGASGTGLMGLQTLKYGRNLRTCFRWGYNIIVLHSDPLQWQEYMEVPAAGRRIDVWWQADATSRLMLLLAYLMTRRDVWAQAEIRVLTAGNGKHLAQAKADLVQTLDDVRIDALAHIVEQINAETVCTLSADSHFVFMPFGINEYKLVDVNGMSLDRTLPKIPPAALVMAAEDIDLDAEPEEGSAGQLAMALDALDEAERRQAKALREEKRTRDIVDQLVAKQKQWLEDPSENDASDRLAEIETALARARKAAENAFRKAAKSKVKAEDAEKSVWKLQGLPPEEP